ncbi:MAG: hypothetical protein A2W00_13595 [Candidatus Eisenbacteria bacterium RBG_16_71_46]|nr:MAG: hypothetical protein A2W00_13595 [Candidatus Eisenbacteria bacterium RBG_16_71_46]OGF24591.1 MAG: hypothetical protein A2V63_07660 [Candidatus Eisenbacteria bacterium RBG_19FT_COMBO_70_11]
MRRVLVVEDDPHNAVLFRRLLERRGGFQVTVTESAEEIFALMRERKVDLVIMDVSLKNTKWEGQPLNGVEICRRLKSDPETASIPVVLATAHAMRGDAEKLLEQSQADDYIAKPIVDHVAFVRQVQGLVGEAA